jgi:glycosyltransferase involved in cell wall biosynthesis|tara:strand:- start:44 stop:1027 length:984 start_codon:yes stop_codon:yes gene_type:complete
MDKRKFKAFNHPWHLAHQYELSKLPFVDWEYLIQFRRPYSKHSRGDFMKNWVTHYEPGRYDFALLHIDQQCIETAIMERGKGSLYMELNKVIQDIPKIVIMHGTTYYPEKFSRDEIIEKVKNIVGENTMVTNSRQCAKDFGFGMPIVHGIEPDEWYDLPKEPRVVTMISPAGLDKYYDRQFLEAIREELLERGIQHCHLTVDWQAKDWDDYRNFLGRSLIYLLPCKDSPMPRSRTEAMLSGCCVLTTPWQDAGDFIEHEKNGFIIGDEKTGIPRNPHAVADLIEELFNDYKRAVRIGQAGKKTAIEKFSPARYQNDWYNLITSVVKK